MDFSDVTTGILAGLKTWEPKLAQLTAETIMNKRNLQNRSIKQVLGHMVDSEIGRAHV